MATKANGKKTSRTSTSSAIRARLRAGISKHIDAMGFDTARAALRTGLTMAQTSRLRNDYDAFSLDRLVDVGAKMGLNVHALMAPAK